MSLPRLARAAGLRWPAEESFEFSKDCFGLDQSQVRLYTAIARHTVLVTAALAICAVTAALLRRRTDTRAPAPHPPRPGPTRRPSHDPADRPRSRPAARPPTATGHYRAMAGLAAPVPGPLGLVRQRTRLTRGSRIAGS